MKDSIRKKLREQWGLEEPQVTSPLAKELDGIARSSNDISQIELALKDVERRYESKYGEYEGDSYGIIDAIKRVIPNKLAKVYDGMHPNVRNEQNEMNEGLDVNGFIKLAMKGGFETPEAAKRHLSNTLNKIKSLPNELTLYRVVFVDDPKQINNKEVGSHYVDNRGDLERSHSQSSHVGGGKPFILTVKAPKGLLDVKATIENKMLYPHENEVTLKNKGVGAKIVKVEPFETNDEDLIGTPDDFADYSMDY